MNSLRILLVDDHLLFRKGLARLLDAQSDFEVIGEARDGLEAVEQTASLRPDLVLMDVRMPNCDGLEATRRIKAQMPEVRVVMLTVSDDERDLYVLRGLRYEKLKGKRSHQHSIRLGKQFRLIIEREQDEQGRYLLIVAIEDYH